jgi:hypothetical protein
MVAGDPGLLQGDDPPTSRFTAVLLLTANPDSTREGLLIADCQPSGSGQLGGMKIGGVIFAIAALATIATGTDLALRDGRVLSDARIVAQTPRTVVVRQPGGLVAVDKALLPPDQAALYPVDEVAAWEADRQAAAALAALAAGEKAAVDRAAQAHKQEREVRLATAARQAEETMVREKAAVLAKAYFEDRLRLRGGLMTWCHITIAECLPVEGAEGRWSLAGRAFIRRTSYLDQSAGTLTGATFSEVRPFSGTYGTKDGAPFVDLVVP